MSPGPTASPRCPAILLDFDPAFEIQPRLRQAVDQVVPLPSPPKWLCPPDRGRALERNLSHLPPGRLTFIGSGDYHYLTNFFLRQISRPFTLVLIDHHDDAADATNEWLTCGNWVRFTERHRSLKRIVYTDGAGLSIAEPSPKRFLWTKIPLSHPLTGNPAPLLAQIPTAGVYVSIDKDVLDTRAAHTNWDQGGLDAQSLIHLFETVALRRSVIGADVCGELSPALPGLPTRQEEEAAQKNESVNLALLNVWRRITVRPALPRPAGPPSPRRFLPGAGL
ncbi:arginase family protein [Kyrpidia spormannii]|uniref:Arginase n=1 Tax=Kyrpidia spormannii TaxID=2055160 RepID=A0A6F9EG30_9BACL|nr:arginase family protein [Kyrpidia spormannii]CAB3395375.1 conserved protein of unknown function [Kyrpidia spormannii]